MFCWSFKIVRRFDDIILKCSDFVDGFGYFWVLWFLKFWIRLLVRSLKIVSYVCRIYKRRGVEFVLMDELENIFSRFEIWLGEWKRFWFFLMLW